ncbi:MAG: hypothetical protein IJX87_04550 [Clostridia bacterium]|nr:hypothetical protein [Clostridia bacterium]
MPLERTTIHSATAVNDHTDWLNYVCDAFDYPVEAKSELINCYQTLKENKQAFTQFGDTLQKYADDHKTDFSMMSEQIKNAAETAGINEYTAYTLFVLCLLQPLKNFYADNGYSSDMWGEVALDIRYKLLECYDVYGVYGTFVMPWFEKFFDLTRFCFGRLQMETVALDGDYVVNGVTLKKGDTVLSVHIPKTGRPLDKTSVEESYRKAREFYKEYFPSGYTVFTCKTYLMHSSTLSLLNQDSNIYKFVCDYEIVYCRDYEDYSELWRLFDRKINDRDVTDLPADTSLRRKFIEYMKSGQKIGYGHGIFVQKH